MVEGMKRYALCFENSSHVGWPDVETLREFAVSNK
jgi:hypothetical protein